MEDISLRLPGRSWSRHRFCPGGWWSGAKALEHYGLRVTTMGRGLDEDREFFLACGACAAAAGKMVKRENQLYQCWLRAINDELQVPGNRDNWD